MKPQTKLQQFLCTHFWMVIAAYTFVSSERVVGGEVCAVLKGTYEYSVYQGAEKPLSSAQYEFEVLVKDCFWRIRYLDAAALTNAEILELETIASCDRTNIYVVQFQNQNAVKAAWGDRYDSVKNRLPVAMSHIYSGEYPPPKEPMLQNIWRAFASSCVFRDQKGKAKPPFVVDMEIFSDPDYYCEYHWETNHNETELRKLVLTDTGADVTRLFQAK